jgi:hypothetical protein
MLVLPTIVCDLSHLLILSSQPLYALSSESRNPNLCQTMFAHFVHSNYAIFFFQKKIHYDIECEGIPLD